MAQEAGIVPPEVKEQINNVRTKLYWIYRMRDPKEYKVLLILATLRVFCLSKPDVFRCMHVKVEVGKNQNWFSKNKVVTINCMSLSFQLLYIWSLAFSV